MVQRTIYQNSDIVERVRDYFETCGELRRNNSIKLTRVDAIKH